jgi:thiol-disulfide isomerase/thioredoxin
MDRLKFSQTLLLAALLTVIGLPACSDSQSEAAAQKEQPAVTDKELEGAVYAPEFPEDLAWLNTDQPLSLARFRGKLVLLDFWTYCCINCMHVIPDLKRLEEKYANELVVIGVHSAKFQNEKDSEQIRQAILRYGIEHPVINDNNFDVWNAYGARAWPTLVLINPNGRIITSHSGEGAFDAFDPTISRAVAYFETRGQLQRSKATFALEEDTRPKTLLAFPGKVTADQKTNRLFITDSNHNRVVITDASGAVLDVIGSGRPGAADGGFDAAAFDHPQGTALDGDILYIADTENHLVRAADLKARTVTTVLGTGKQARSYNQPGTGTAVALNSPWDVLVLGNNLYIAMAGSHQIWRADRSTWDATPFAGSGREDIVDGPRLSAALAQTSGLTTDGKRIYFADSETSSVRFVELGGDETVHTLIGEGLFDFGDVDGERAVALLQHPLGITLYHDTLLIADTYNSKIKKIEPTTAVSATFAGTGKHGYADGAPRQAAFNEPSGLAVLGNTLFVADANNGLIRTVDLTTGTVGTLQLGNVDKLARRRIASFNGRTLTLPPQRIKTGHSTLSLQVELPHGYKFTHDAPSFLKYYSADRAVLAFQNSSDELEAKSISFPENLDVTTHPGNSELTVDAVIYYCAEGSTVCLFDNVRIQVPVMVADDAPMTLALTIEAKQPAGN